ncbi:Coatomer subunit delta [Balamuthia mandrillaris]
MVVLAVAVCTKNGKALVSRQFVDITRTRIEGLLAAFPNLMGTGKQHTFIETENVRYVYQPLENLYMLLLTNKSSNILEDLETLNILAKIVPEYCRVLDEEEVANNAFKLIWAFDEVIAMGYKEKVTLSQIKTFMAMDSYDEKVHEVMERNKELEALEEAKRKRQQIEKMRQESLRAAQAGGMGGMGSMGGMGGMGGLGSRSSSWQGSNEPLAQPIIVQERERPKATAPPGGMVLGKKEATSKFMQAMQKEEDLDLREPSETLTGAPSAPKESVRVEILENINATLENDGGLPNVEVRGHLTFIIDDEQYSDVVLRLSQPADNKNNFHFKAHPNIDKNRFMKEKIVSPKGGKRGFPVRTALNILKWRLQTTDENLVPLTVNCWPSAGGGGSTVVNMEYELHTIKPGFALGNVSIAIPIIGGTPTVEDVDGTYEFDLKNHILYWRLDLIDESNSSGAMEFTVPGLSDGSSLFPIKVSFMSQLTYCDIVLEGIENSEGAPVKYSLEKALHADEYQVV